MAVVSVVANGTDNYASWLSFLGGSPLDTRIANFLNLYDNVLQVSVDDKSRLFSIWGGTYPFQANIRIDTRNQPADVQSVTERIKLALVQATGHFPSAIAVTSAGQPAPTPPPEGVGDSLGTFGKGIADLVASLPAGVQELVNNVKNGLSVTLTTAVLLIIALGIGAIALVYWIATHPEKSARLARA